MTLEERSPTEEATHKPADEGAETKSDSEACSETNSESECRGAPGMDCGAEQALKRSGADSDIGSVNQESTLILEYSMKGDAKLVSKSEKKEIGSEDDERLGSGKEWASSVVADAECLEDVRKELLGDQSVECETEADNMPQIAHGQGSTAAVQTVSNAAEDEALSSPAHQPADVHSPEGLHQHGTGEEHIFPAYQSEDSESNGGSQKSYGEAHGGTVHQIAESKSVGGSQQPLVEAPGGTARHIDASKSVEGWQKPVGEATASIAQEIAGNNMMDGSRKAGSTAPLDPSLRIPRLSSMEGSQRPKGVTSADTVHASAGIPTLKEYQQPGGETLVGLAGDRERSKADEDILPIGTEASVHIAHDATEVDSQHEPPCSVRRTLPEMRMDCEVGGEKGAGAESEEVEQSTDVASGCGDLQTHPRPPDQQQRGSGLHTVSAGGTSSHTERPSLSARKVPLRLTIDTQATPQMCGSGASPRHASLHSSSGPEQQKSSRSTGQQRTTSSGSGRLRVRASPVRQAGTPEGGRTGDPIRPKHQDGTPGSGRLRVPVSPAGTDEMSVSGRTVVSVSPVRRGSATSNDNRSRVGHSPNNFDAVRTPSSGSASVLRRHEPTPKLQIKRTKKFYQALRLLQVRSLYQLLRPF